VRHFVAVVFEDAVELGAVDEVASLDELKFRALLPQ